jgi:hypothetical protein
MPVPHAAEGSMMVKEEEMVDLAPDTLVDPVQGAQPPKAKLELEPTAFHAMTDSACLGMDSNGDGVSQRLPLGHPLAKRQKDQENLI